MVLPDVNHHTPPVSELGLQAEGNILVKKVNEFKLFGILKRQRNEKFLDFLVVPSKSFSV